MSRRHYRTQPERYALASKHFYPDGNRFVSKLQRASGGRVENIQVRFNDESPGTR